VYHFVIDAHPFAANRPLSGGMGFQVICRRYRWTESD
jgi:hypothetical protein